MNGHAQSETEESRNFVVLIPVGLHLRPAAKLVRTACDFDSDITVSCNGAIASAKSLIGIAMLSAACGTEIVVAAVGHDAQPAMAAIEDLFQSAFGE
jgi:phosphocarrier protein HPr